MKKLPLAVILFLLVYPVQPTSAGIKAGTYGDGSVKEFFVVTENEGSALKAGVPFIHATRWALGDLTSHIVFSETLHVTEGGAFVETCLMEGDVLKATERIPFGRKEEGLGIASQRCRAREPIEPTPGDPRDLSPAASRPQRRISHLRPDPSAGPTARCDHFRNRRSRRSFHTVSRFDAMRRAE